MDRKEAIELIKRHMIIHQIGKYPHIKLGEALSLAIKALQELERKKGHWIGDFGNSEYNDWHCSNCRRYYPERNKKLLGDYCPWCGADMRGEEE